MTDTAAIRARATLPGYQEGQALQDALALCDALDEARAENERLGRDLNMAKYGKPDFAWSTHLEVMADLRAENERLRSERPYIVGWNAGFAFATSTYESPEEHWHSEGAAEIARERERQMRIEGWTPEHDDTHKSDELPTAALGYLSAVVYPDEEVWSACEQNPPCDWPWSFDWWKPGTNRQMLIKAGALIAAEIDRIDRVDRAQGEE